MTEISLQIQYNNSSEAFLSSPLATCLQKFSGGAQKQRLTPSFPCTSVACWVPSPPQVEAAHMVSCGACSGALSKGTPAWQSTRVWRTPWQANSAACLKTATLESLSPPSLLPQQKSTPFGSSAALQFQHYCCLPRPKGFVSSLQPTKIPVPKWATRGLGDSLVGLHWAISCNKDTVWGQQAVDAGEVTQDETASKWCNPSFSGCFGLQDGERKRKGVWVGRHGQFNLIC